ncbi:F-box protein CPR30-like [Prunus yedoensis var. nudiflora]|uniref:F-box protein CPR30-like n=1 Tax=Prunus yedoensis var. nudiflora TaxID=2094558 RepID=A0A314Z331_PRUYE|nr:F-box protein CPR30-like [Prunus yedoensis var. nudiflora]
MINIPTDVFANILCRLPVKSLKRFQCVCKSWYELIKNPNFIIQHLHQYSNNKNVSENCLLFTHTTPCRCHPTHLEPADHVNSLYAYNIEEDVSLHLLDLPYRDEKLYLDIFGPCNGIYCLHHLRSIMLVNVALREFQVLVYSSSCNSWRKADDTVPSSVDVSIIKSSINTYVKGNFHWLAANFVPGDVTAYYRVLCFSMFDEVLHEMRLPSCLTVVQDSDSTFYELASYNGSLSLIVSPCKPQEQWFDVWVKQDYDDDDSWTKLLSIRLVAGIFKPMGFWRDGQFLLDDCSGQLVLYNPKAL